MGEIDDLPIAMLNLSGPKASRILRPGLRTLAAGTERYRVAGGGSLTLRLREGDRLEIVDLEGLQPAELTPMGPDGKPDAAILGMAEARAPIRIFGTGPAGERVTFTCRREAILRVAAPGAIMDLERQDTATDLEVFI